MLKHITIIALIFPLVTALSSFNARVVLAEYPGYGERPGVPSVNTFVSDSQKTLDVVSTQTNL